MNAACDWEINYGSPHLWSCNSLAKKPKGTHVKLRLSCTQLPQDATFPHSALQEEPESPCGCYHSGTAPLVSRPGAFRCFLLLDRGTVWPVPLTLSWDSQHLLEERPGFLVSLIWLDIRAEKNS